MKVVIPTDSGNVSMHFGRCSEFTIFEIEDDEIKNKEVIESPGHRPGFLPKLLKKKEIDCLITGGIGRKAVSLFEDFGIEVVSGVRGEVDEVIKDFLEGKVKGKNNICDH